MIYKTLNRTLKSEQHELRRQKRVICLIQIVRTNVLSEFEMTKNR